MNMRANGINLVCMSHHASHLMLKETVLQGFVSRVASCTLKQQLVLLQNNCNN